MDYFDILRNNRDKELLQKLSNPINSDAYTESSRDELWDRFVKEYRIHLQQDYEEELEDWELDNLLEGQEDDTVDETIEPLYCNAVYNENRLKAKKGDYSQLPSNFYKWSKLCQDKWLEKAKKVNGKDFEL